MEQTFFETFPEAANILMCIVDFPMEDDPVKRSDYFKVIQQHSKKFFNKLSETSL